MGLSLGTLTKMARGGMSLEDVTGILAGAGVDLTMTNLETREAVSQEFTVAARGAARPGARVIAVKGKMKDGSTVHALLTLYS
jgi:hypothetical protein